MKTHPEFYAWLFLIAGYAFLLALAAVAYRWRAIRQWVSEWLFVIREIWNDNGKRWQDHG